MYKFSSLRGVALLLIVSLALISLLIAGGCGGSGTGQPSSSQTSSDPNSATSTSGSAPDSEVDATAQYLVLTADDGTRSAPSGIPAVISISMPTTIKMSQTVTITSSLTTVTQAPIAGRVLSVYVLLPNYYSYAASLSTANDGNARVNLQPSKFGLKPGRYAIGISYDGGGYGSSFQTTAFTVIQ